MSVFDYESSSGRDTAVGAFFAAERAQNRNAAIALDFHFHVAAFNAVSIAQMRVLRERILHLFLRGALRGDRSSAKLGRDDWRLRIVEVRLEIGDPGAMHVASDHQRVRSPRLCDVIEETCARSRITIPAISPEALARPRL